MVTTVSAPPTTGIVEPFRLMRRTMRADFHYLSSPFLISEEGEDAFREQVHLLKTPEDHRPVRRD